MSKYSLGLSPQLLTCVPEAVIRSIPFIFNSILDLGAFRNGSSTFRIFGIANSSLISRPITVTGRMARWAKVHREIPALCRNSEKFDNFPLSQLGEPLLRQRLSRTWLAGRDFWLAERNQFYLRRE